MIRRRDGRRSYCKVQRTVTPIKLQAYERIVLFLERISLESLLVRVSSPEMTASQLHTALLNCIRSEFEHNLSQQIYMSPQAWEVVKNARSNTIKIINSEAEKIKGNAPGIEFSKHLITRVMEIEKEPTRQQSISEYEYLEEAGNLRKNDLRLHYRSSTLLLTNVLRSSPLSILLASRARSIVASQLYCLIRMLQVSLFWPILKVSSSFLSFSRSSFSN